jgi:polysaccharide deacetylase family protein (PEP-CTERM system associated)
MTVSHIFTVDVEEYFQVLAFQGTINSADWNQWPSRAEAGVDILLGLLSEQGYSGTFFTVGWLAERQPSLVRRIADEGHELASHTWWHRAVDRVTRDEFRQDVGRTRALLQDLTGQPIFGFRAPSFSIGPHNEWAFDILLEEGYRYDSSIFPIRRPDYGDPSAPTVPYMIERPGGSLLELPLATTAVAGLRLPAAGGGYFRQFPYALTQRAFRELGRAGESGVFYIHPWELDPDQPRVAAPLLSRARHYRGLEKTVPRLRRLVAEFRFTSAAQRYSITDEWVPAMPT